MAGRPAARELTGRQEEALQAIGRSWREERAPTTGELVDALRLAGESGLTALLRPLAEKGYIAVEGGVRGRQRRIELTASGRARLQFGVPVLGSIPAGPLAEAVQQTGEWFPSLASALPYRPGDFALRVQGDSMIGAGILPGDLVLLRPGIEARSGEIVAAQVHDEAAGQVEATLKYLDFVTGRATVWLRAANPEYPDREVDAAHLTIAGVFRGLIRVPE